ncbi:MAG: NYN domain-containing protein, partial [Clostridia bacterium]|nr:NYN domain-containing protein [Clostridia bacterium]
RIYSGIKYKNEQQALPGTVCAVTGLSESFAGQGLGFEKDLSSFTFEPVFSYKVRLQDGYDINTALRNLKKLEEEESQLHVEWSEALSEIHIQLMGEVQSEVLKCILSDRFGMSVEFEQGGIIYKETIRNTVLGVGHFEPLRHYAEVHLLMEPGKPGSGLVFETKCSEDELEKNWQRLILTHLEEKTHLGVLTGAPITDIKITLVAGRAHKKHTEGGDFRQATYRAVRQGLMQAESVLLEPWYSFTLTINTSSLGRAMTDIQNMGGKFTPPENRDNVSILRGYAPVQGLCNYSAEVRAYTHGLGILECMPAGYEPCKSMQEIIQASDYDPEQDTDNTPDSVFCAHGAGYVVKWNQVHQNMHIEDTRKKPADEITAMQSAPRRSSNYADDDELMRIFERTYGKIQQKPHTSFRSQKLPENVAKKYKAQNNPLGEYLLVDGYNILFAWFDLSKATTEDLDIARNYLINRLSTYKEMKGCEIIIVFDAYKVKGGLGSYERIGHVDVVYTKEAETADSYIERTARDISKKNYSVKVATSDRLEQVIIFGSGAFRISAEEFLKDIELAENRLEEIISNLQTGNQPLSQIKITELKKD